MERFGDRLKFGYLSGECSWAAVGALMEKDPGEAAGPAFQIAHTGALGQSLLQVPEISPLTFQPAVNRGTPERREISPNLRALAPGFHPFCGLCQGGCEETDATTARGAEDGNTKHWRGEARESPELTAPQQVSGSAATACYLQFVLGYWPGSAVRARGEKAPQTSLEVLQADQLLCSVSTCQ